MSESTNLLDLSGRVALISGAGPQGVSGKPFWKGDLSSITVGRLDDRTNLPSEWRLQCQPLTT